MINSKTANTIPVSAVFFDIDGTLLDFETHSLSASTVSAIRELKSRGLKVAVATSRPWRTMAEIPGLLDLDLDGYVTASGGQVYDGNQKLIYDASFSIPQLRQITSLAVQNDIPLYMAGDDILITASTPLIPAFLEKYHISIDGVHPWNGEHTPLVTTITEDTDNAIRVFSQIPGLLLVKGGSVNVDMRPDGLDKPEGIHRLMEHWNLPVHSYLAFGDTQIDAGMLRDARISAAMPWADQDARAAADFILEDHRENSLSEWLKSQGFITGEAKDSNTEKTGN